MKMLTHLAVATAIALSGATPLLAQENAVTSDPFISTQGGQESFLGLGGVGGVLVSVTLITFIIALSDSSSSSTT